MDAAAKTVDYQVMRFLIADDKAFIRSIVQRMLMRLKAKLIIQATNGEQARKLLRKYGKRIHCIISDWNMSPVGGLELLRATRAGEIRNLPPDICFIMLTGHSVEKVVKAAVALDVSGYLVKPVSFEKLAKTIESAMMRTIIPKSPEYYQAVTGLEIPQEMKVADAHVPPWVMWITKSPRREQLEERMKQLRRDAAALKSEGGDDAFEVENTRRVTLAEIKPGVVLAEDVYAGDRGLLVAAGTSLNAGLLARLKELTEEGGEEMRLWVGDRVKSPPA